MVAIVSGNGFGLINGSAGVLGQQGLFGNATMGSAKEGAYLNIFNGNLSLQNTDDFLAAHGINLAFTRTYNAQGGFDDGNGKGWITGIARLTGIPAVPGADGSTITRIAGDGSSSIFTYDQNRKAYVSTDGAGAYQTLTWTGGQWIWKSGQTGANGLYESYDNGTGRLNATGDQFGIRTKYYYNAAGRLSQVTDSANSTGKAGTQTATTSDQTYYDYDTRGNLTQIRQVLASAGGTTIRTHYEYDTLDRLTRVVTDLTPADGKITDNNVYSVSYAYAGDSNRIAFVTQADGTQLSFLYDADGRVQQFTEHSVGTPDRRIAIGYQVLADGTRRTTVSDDQNNTTTYTADAQGRLVQVENAQQNVRFGYNARGDVISSTDARGNVTTFDYDDNGNCIRQVDAAGNVIARTYSAANPANPATDPGNRLLTETLYPATGVNGAASQPQTTRYVYEDDAGINGRLRFVISPQGRVTEYTYDTLGVRTSEWTFMAQAYNVAALSSAAVPTEKQVTDWIATTAVNKNLITRTDYGYNTRGQVTTATTYSTASTTTVTTAGRAIVRYTYDAAGNLLTAVDALNNTTTYTYDGLGRVLTKTDPNGLTQYTYPANAVSTRVTDPSGLVTERVYDIAGRLLSTTASYNNAVVSATRNVYDNAGQLRMTVDPAGRKTIWLYDAAGRKVAEVGPDGALTEFVYDGGNQPVRTVRYATRIAQSSLLEASGEPRTDLQPANIRPATTAFDRTTWNAYDTAGRLVATVDGERYLTRYVYDAAGHLVSTIERAKQLASVGDAIAASYAGEASANDRIARSFYDADGRLAGKLDALGYLTEYVYDAGGRLTDTIAYANPANLAGIAQGVAGLRPTAAATDVRQRVLYDGRGLVVATVDGDNYVTELEYDANGNVTKRTRYADPSTNPAGATVALVKTGTVASNADNRITVYTYTPLNQLLTESVVDEAGTVIGQALTYTYDKLGNVTKIVRAGGTTTLTEYDALGRVVAEKVGTTATLPTRYTYNAAGQRTSATDPNGNRTLYFYDAAGRLAVTVNALGEATEQTYDAFGQVAVSRKYDTRIATAALTPDSSLATVQELLRTATIGQRNVFYYDRDGRLTYTVDGAGGVTEQRYGAFAQATSTARYAGSLAPAALAGGMPDAALKAFVADLAAHPIQLAVYEYDANGRLTYSANPAANAQGYRYDAFGRVTAKTAYAIPGGTATAGDSVQRYGYDERGNVISYTDAMGNVVATTFNAFSQATARTSAGSFIAGTTPSTGVTTNASAVVAAATERTYYNDDGRIVATVDAAGALTTYAYDGDGNVIQRQRYATALAAAGQASLASATAATVKGLFTANTSIDEDVRTFYDTQSRPIYTVTRTAGSNWTLQTRTYDAAGNVTETRTYAKPMPVATPTAASIASWIAVTTNSGATDAVQRSFFDATGRVIATLTRSTGTDGTAAESWAVSTFEYDARGNLAGKTAYATPLPVANPTLATLATVATSNADALVRYRYDGANRLSLTATALGRTTVVEGGVETSKIRWQISSVDYDAQGNVGTRSDYTTVVTTGTSTAESPFNAVFAGEARVTRYVYDAANRVIRTIDSANAVVSFEYDARGNVIKRTEHATPTDYTGKLPAANVADRVTRTVYDLNNRPKYEIDAAGAVTERTYDGLGNVTAIVQYATPAKPANWPAAPTADYVKGLLGSAKPADRTTRYVYDQNGRLRFTVDPLGYLTERQYDGLGRAVVSYVYQTAVTVATATLATDVLNAAAAQMKGTLPPRRTASAYDAQGNLLSVTDALNYSESYTYDALGRKKTFTNKLTNVWTYDYDATGRLVLETAPAVTAYLNPANMAEATSVALKTRLVYDALGNLVARTEADGTAQARTTKYRYDAAGHQIQTIAPDVLVYQEATDSLVTATAPTVTVTYDALGNAIANRDVGGNVSYKVYDRRGQVVFDIDAQGQVTGYERDAFGQVTAMTRYVTPLAIATLADAAQRGEREIRALLKTSPDDRTIRTTYTLRGQVDVVTEPTATVFDSHSTTGSTLLAAARTTRTEYNAFGETIRVSVYGSVNGQPVTQVAGSTYYYDLRGAKAAQVDTAADNRGYLTSYGYDAAGNLVDQYEYAIAIGSWSLDSYAAGTKKPGEDRQTTYAYGATNLRTTETRVGAFVNASGGREDIVTRYNYNKLGNQTSVLDASGLYSYTYYDVLGRVTGTASPLAANQPTGTKAPFTELRRDLFGNVVFQIQYAGGASGTVAEGVMPTAAAAPSGESNRITTTTYDNAGRATKVVDAAGGVINLAYDVFGRVAKQWRDVTYQVTATTTDKTTIYQINRYDALGRLIEVTRPSNVDLINGNAYATATQRNAYNAFGEVIEVSQLLASADKTSTKTRLVSFTRYDNAGRAWLTNADGGVDTVTLYDVLGNATASIRNAGTDMQLLRRLTDAAGAAALTDVLRVDTRYDLMGRKLDVRQQIDTQQYVLTLNPATQVWERTPQQGDTKANSIILVGTVDDALGAVVTVQYRLKGSGAWIDQSGNRLRKAGDYLGFDTIGMPSGEYEYRVTVQPAGEAAFERETGMLRIESTASRDVNSLLASVYLAMLNRGPDVNGMNFYVDKVNQGIPLQTLLETFVKSDEYTKRYGADANGLAVVRLIFQDAFGRTDPGTNKAADPNYTADLNFWAAKYNAAKAAVPSQLGNFMLELVNTVLRYDGADAAMQRARTRLTNRTQATLAYAVDYRGNNPATRDAVMLKADTDLAAAIALAKDKGTDELTRAQVAQIYLTLFGRAPDLGGMTFAVEVLGKSAVTLEQFAQDVLNSPEARDPFLFPTDGLTTAQYRQQLVRRAYQMALGRAATQAEETSWLAKLNGSPALTYGQFVVQLAESIASYTGTDAQRLAEKTTFNQKTAAALELAKIDILNSPDIGKFTMDEYAKISRATMAAITSGVTATDAVKAAVDRAKATLDALNAVQAATGAATGAEPLKESRVQLARLYVALFGRVPDTKGMEFYLKALETADRSAPTAAQWIGIVGDLLRSDEATKAGLGAAIADRAFVERIYQQALGSVPRSAAVTAEIDGFVAQLATKSRAEVAFAVINGMLEGSGMGSAERTLKSTFDNKVAVGLVCAFSIGTNDWSTGDNTWSTLLATTATEGISRALADAYAYTQQQVLKASAGAIDGAGKAVTAAGLATTAAAAAAKAKAEADAAAAAAAVAGQASIRLQIMQIYVGLLGRTPAQYSTAPDLAGFEFQVNAAATHSLATIADGMINDAEGAPLKALTNAAFVARIFQNAVGVTTLGTQLAAPWLAKLNAGTATRGEVAVGILQQVRDYATAYPDAAAQAFLAGRQGFDQRVADSFGYLNAAQQTAASAAQKPVQAIIDLGNTLPGLQQQQDSALASQRAAQAAYTNALNNAAKAGDGTAIRRLTLTRMYATLLQRTPSNPPDLSGINYYLNATTDMGAIAQGLIDSTEARGVYPADNRAFVAKLYDLVLGRPATSTEIDYWVGVLPKYSPQSTARGQLAMDMLNNWVNYSENDAAGLARKVAFDNKITQMLAFNKSEAATAYTNADAALSNANTALSNAQSAYSAAVSASSAAASAATTAQANAVDAERIITYSRYQSEVTYAYVALRGSSDFSGVAFNMWGRGQGATMESIIETLLKDDGWPTGSTAFVQKLYSKVLGRTGSTEEVAWWAKNMDTGISRAAIAKDFISNSEATSRHASTLSARISSYTSTANSLIRTRDTAVANASTAAAKVTTTKATLDQAKTAQGSAAVAADKAYNVLLTYNQLVSAHALLPAANSAYQTYATARDNYVSAKSRYDTLSTQQAAELAAYQAAQKAATEDPVTLALARANAKLSGAVADVAARNVADNAAPATQRAADLVAKMYVTLLNRAPLLAELRVWTEQLAKGATAADVARGIMNSGAAAGLYPAGLSDTAFVTQLYRFSLGRGVEADGAGLAFWANQLSGANPISRAELAANWVQGLSTGITTDTPLFLSKAVAALQAVIQESKSGTGPNLMPAVLLSEELAASAAGTYDATALARLAALPMGASVRPLVRLYVALFNRVPDAAGFAFWMNALKSQPLSVVAQGLLSDIEGQQVLPASMNTSEFIATLMRNLTGHAPTDGELAPYVARFGALSRVDIALALPNALADERGNDLLQIANRYLVNQKLDGVLDELAPAVLAAAMQQAAAAVLLNQVAAKNPVDLHADVVVLGINAVIKQGAKADAVRDTYQYDRWGNVVSMLDARDPNWVTTYTYNADNQLVTQTMVTKPGKPVVYAQTNTYDKLGNLLTTKDAEDAVTTYTYNAYGFLTDEVHTRAGVTGSRTGYTVNAFGDRTTVRQFTDSVNSVDTYYAYDALGRVISRTTEAVKASNWVAAAGVNISLNTLSSAQLVERYTYDELGRRIKTVSGAVLSGTSTDPNAAASTVVRYDVSGNVVSVTDAKGARTLTAYDDLNRKTDEQVAASSNNRKHWEIDEYGRVTWHTDLGGNITYYDYNAAGQLIKSTTDSAQRQLPNTVPGDYTWEHQVLTYTYERGSGRLRKIEDAVLRQVTEYNYDRAGNRVTEKVWLAGANRAVQDHVNRYDEQGRLARVTSRVPNANYDIQYEYDDNGNRLHVTTKFVNDAAYDKTIDVRYEYDLMNRQTRVYGNTVTLGEPRTTNPKLIEMNGDDPDWWYNDKPIVEHNITYNWMGNRLTDTSGGVKEIYSYDEAGRLTTIHKNSITTANLIGSRDYDTAGRVAKSFDTTATGTKEYRYYAYDVMGRVKTQMLTGADNKQINLIDYAYDDLGNMTSYLVEGTDTTKYVQSVVNVYGQLRESYLLTNTTVTNVGTNQSKWSAMVYDVNGNMKHVVEDGKTRTLISDSNGHVLEKNENGLVTHSLIVNGQTLGSSSRAYESFSSVYDDISTTSNTDGPSGYVVQAGDTLQSIAKAVWGDERLWYLIADANGGIDASGAALTPGQPLTIPARVGTIYNGADTFKPYSAADAIGNTTPELALPTPQGKSGGGCGGLGKLVMVVVAVVATIYTAGAASSLLAGQAIGSFGATMAAGSAAIAGGSVGAAAIGGALGSIASQAVGIAIGAQDSFSWKGVALSAIGSGVSAGVAGAAGNLGGVFAETGTAGQVARAALGNVAMQGASIVTGLQSGFNWRGVAASAAGAAAGAAVGRYLGGNEAFNQAFGGASALAKDTLTGMAYTTAASIVRGGKIDLAQIATDAFGNALGASIARLNSEPPVSKLWAGVDVDRMDAIMRDVLENGERFASIGSPSGSSSAGLRSLRDEEMARIIGQAQAEQQMTWDPEVGGYRDRDGVLRVEISGVNAIPSEPVEVPVAPLSSAEPTAPSGLAKIADYTIGFLDWTRSSALSTVGATYDSFQRAGYMQAIKANSANAVQAIRALGPTQMPQVEALARAASDFRDATRTATQARLTPWGTFMSRKIEGDKNVPFESRMADREVKLTKDLKRPPTQFELMEGVAAGAGKSNPWVSRIAYGMRVAGPVLAAGQLAMVGSHVYNAAPQDRLRVAGTEGFKLSSSLLYGALGSMAGVAVAGALIASPVGVALAGYAGVTYLAASFGGGIAGSMLGSWTADRILGQH